MKKAVWFLLCCCPAVWAGMITDDFNRSSTGPAYTTNGSVIGTGWVDNGNGSWRINNNVLEMDSLRNPSGIYNIGQQTISGGGTNMTLSGDVSVNINNGWGGIMFNYQDTDNYYVIRFKGGTTSYQFLAVENGGNATVVSKTDATATFTSGSFYTITITSDTAYNFDFTITAAGSSTVLNPTTSISESNAQFAGGYAGFYSPTGNAVTPEVSFDNFSLNVVPEPATIGMMGTVFGLAALIRRRFI